jgi:predicted ribonuclease YlaK
MNKYKFYDTSSLLLLSDEELNQNFIISSITLNELENIKTSRNKDFEVKVAARHVLHKLFENRGKYQIVIYQPEDLELLGDNHFDITDDIRILSGALWADHNIAPDDITFVTNDLALMMIANLYFGSDSIEQVVPKEDDYTGFKEVRMNENEMTAFYMEPNNNCFNLLQNEYLIVREADTNNIVDRLCWTGSEYRHLDFNNFKSKWFGEVRPIAGDTYQMLAADSLSNNQITMLKGPAGSGKTFLALAYLLHKLDKGKIDKIIVFCNTVATKGSAKLGYLPGTRDEKLLDSQIGNLLASKLGDRTEVERMVEDGKLLLLPCSDIRGFDTSGMRAGIYISEAQNMDINLMKLALQRIGEDSICIIDGDPLTQVDDDAFAGHNNGMRRASEVFRGTEVYGEVELQTIHRSRIASIAQNM